MPSPVRRFSLSAFAAFLAFLFLALAQPARAAEEVQLRVPHNAFGKVGREDLAAPLRQRGTIRVIVGMQNAGEAPQRSDATPDGVRQQAVTARQSRVLQRLQGHNLRGIKRLRHHHFMSVVVDAAALNALLADPEVTSVTEDRPVYLTLLETPGVVHADTAWAAGYRGAGQVVAIIDTGVDKTHPFFSGSGKVVAEACFSDPAGANQSYCPGGASSSTATGSGGPCPDLTLGCRHGTHVAGIAAGSTGSGPIPNGGMASSAGVIAIQVFQYVCSNCQIVAYDSDIVLALEHVYSLRNTHSIASINMSLGGDLYSGSCDASLPSYKTVIDNLRAANIATVIASGNQSNGGAIAAPACISSAVSVGSTTKTDAISSFSNSSASLSLLAPGSAIYSSFPVAAGSYGTSSGTSMATPHVAGAWAVLKSAKPTATVNEVLSALQTSGVPITDPRNGITRSRIQIGHDSTTFGALGTLLAPTTEPPTVSITAPQDGASYLAVADVPVSATASDTDGGIHKVEFFSGANIIASLVAAPYSFVWSAVPPGNYTLSAVATDVYGRTTTSAPVSFTVNAPSSSTHAQITGTVQMGGAPLAGVSVTYAPGGSCLTTDAAGQYTCWVPLGWTGTVTPSAYGLGFAPPSRDYVNVTADQPAQHFTGAFVSTNVALASVGAIATASSIFSAGYPVAAVNNNERAGANLGNGGVWADGTGNAYPDWVQINFNGSKSIDRVVVYTVQNNYTNPIEPNDSLTFTLYGIVDFTVQGWNGSAWVTLATVTGNNLVKRVVNFAAYTTDRIRINVTNALGSYSRITEVEAWGIPAPATTTLSSSANPAIAGASVTFTATVTGNAPTGSVAFTEGGTPLSGCSAVALMGTGNARTAACSISSLALGAHSIVATYSGNIANPGSASAALVQNIVAATTTTLASSLNPATFGTSVTFTATVNGSAPTGSVGFTNNGSTISGCSAVALVGSGDARTATCSTSSLAVGNRNIVASYGGNSGNAASTSATLVQVINAVPTTTALSSSLNPSNFGASVTFTATVSGSAPTGSVGFTNNGSNISGCSAVALTGGGNTRTATCTTSSLAVGNRSIVASYGGNSSNAASTSATLVQVINAVPTTTTLSSSLNPATVGAGVTFTATVTGNAPTGSVAFTNGGSAISGCSAVALTGGGNTRSATCSTSSLTIGTHSIVASYAGNSTNAASASSALAQNIVAATTTTLSSSLNPATFGTSVTFTATVTGNAPTGNVAFTNGGSPLSGCSAVALGGEGTATCTTSSLAVGNRNIVASYGGNSGNAASTSATLVQVINTVATTTTLSSSLNPATFGASVTFTATVTGNAPTGNVAFTNGGSAISGCSAVALVGSGDARTATCSTSSLAVGDRNIVASYGGNSSNAASTSATLVQVINAVPTTTTLSSSLNPATFGASVTFTATVVGNAPTGSVSFTDGGNTISGCGAVALTGGGNTRTATCSTSTLTVGTHSIVASYGGNSTNAASASTALAQNILAATTTSLSSSLNPATFGTSVTFTATVTGNAPTGSVAFTDGGSPLSGCSPVALGGGGTATCSTSSLAVGNRNIVASYGGDSSNAASTSATLVQVINGAATATTLSSSLNPANVGASVTFTATVTGNAPTGSVSFTDGGNAIGGCSAVVLSGAGTATCSTSSLAVGTHSIVASYGGDGANPASASAPLAQAINAAPTTTTLSSSLNPATFGASVMLTATVTGNAPTGSVSFTDGGSATGGCSAVALSGGGTATCSTSSLSVGTHSIVASYGGNSTNAASASTALAQVINAAPGGSTTTTLSSSLNPSTVGASVTFTATVSGSSPTGSVAFTDGGSPISDCAAVVLSGAGTATCSTSGLAAGTHSIVASYGGDSANAASASAALSQVVNAAPGGSTNVALASAGAVATASSTFGAGYPVAAVNNNERTGANLGNGGGWADATGNAYPDWVQINFNGSKSIDRVVVYTLQDNYANPIEPTDGLTFNSYGIVDFTVQGWNGSGWVTLATVTGNNLVKRSVTFAAYSTDRIRVHVTNALASYSRITEIEAWSAAAGGLPPTTTTLSSSLNPATAGASVTFTATVSGSSSPTGSVAFTDGGSPISGCAAVALSGGSATCSTSSLAAGTHSIIASYGGDSANAASASAALSQVVNAAPGGSTNVALASAGAVATASSTFGAGYPVAAVNNNERTGANLGNGGGWADATGNAYPDWVQINFNGSKSIDRVVVYTLQDNYANPIEPTDGLTFNSYGIVDFTVQGWNGSGWVTLATVTGNNLVKRSVTFAAYSTDRIRVHVTNALASYSRITEIEAWSAAAGGLPPTTTTVSSSLNPSTVGASVTFTATVSGSSSPTGSVAFTDGGSPISGCAAVALSGGSATCSTSSLAAGTHSIIASYGGDSANAASASAALSQVVNAAPGGSTNVALASAGAVATASSTFGAGYPVAAVNNNERTGANLGNGGGWADATGNAYPDWVQINFNGSKSIDRVVVYTLQDNYANPIEPTDGLTFNSYGIVDFTVQGWNGSGWVTLATVTGNNLVKRSVTFAAYSTDRIRVHVTNALASYSRITEIEAWSAAAGGLPPTTTTLSSSLNPATAGASVTFTATVSGSSSPTGSVAFTDDGNPISGCAAVTLSAGSATCSTSSLSVGTHSIIASYGGDSANAASASPALSQVIAAPVPPAISLQSVATGLSSPVGIEHAADGSGRLFIVQQGGQIRILSGAQILPAPFLNITSLLATGGERGLLGLAFHPNYATNGLFYLNYTRLSDGATVIARYQRSAEDPNIADPSSAQILLTVAQPFANHNGGQLRFGPDGFLYIGLGDGGSANDPGDRAQNLNTLLGKMLRIDVDSGSPYAIPAGNPYQNDGNPDTLAEIWASGLRNPWRFSFDRATGDLFIADVGQSAREEISFQPAGSGAGANYGWRVMEGSQCTGLASVGPACFDASLSPPILEYSHSLGCSVTGGYRYRGAAYPALTGYFLYGDYCSGRIWGAAPVSGAWTANQLLVSGFNISTFGEDEAGEVYVAGYNTGVIYRIAVQ